METSLSFIVLSPSSSLPQLFSRRSAWSHQSHRPYSNSGKPCTIHYHMTLSPPSSTRRAFLVSTLMLPFLTSSTIVLSEQQQQTTIPHRNVFDEERARNEELQRDLENQRLSALRASFDAVNDALGQLDDIDAFIQYNDWVGLRRFLRLFNDAVEREGMEKIANKLSSNNNKKEALKVSKMVTDELMRIDKYTLKQPRNIDDIHQSVDRIKQLVHDFQQFRP